MHVLFTYAEIVLKSRGTRSRMEQQLLFNLSPFCTNLTLDRGVIIGETTRAHLAALRRIFGIETLSVVTPFRFSLDAVAEHVLPLLASHKGTFAVRVKRTGTHSFTSVDIEKRIGELIRKTYPSLSVNLTTPDVVIRLSIRGERAYLITETYRGFGGLPVGCSGEAGAILFDERDALAAWFLLRRGVRVHFFSARTTSLDLSRWGGVAYPSSSLQEFLAHLRHTFPLPVLVGSSREAVRCAHEHRLFLLDSLSGFTSQDISRIIAHVVREEPFSCADVILSNPHPQEP